MLRLPTLSTTLAMTLLLLPFAVGADAPGAPNLPLINFSAPGSEKRLIPSDDQETVAAATPGATVTIRPGTHSWPGTDLKPDTGSSWDLSRFGHIAVRVANTGTKPLLISLRVDDATRNAAENVTIKPGETGTVTTWFTASFGHLASPLDTKAITRLLIFTGKVSETVSYRLESVEAGGASGEQPPIALANVRLRPKDGVLFGPGVTLVPKQLQARGGAQAALSGTTIKATFPATAGAAPAAVVVQPADGRWDLRDALEVTVKVRNDGTGPVIPRVQLLSNGSPTDLVAATAPLAPGAETQIVVPFEPSKTVNMDDKPKYSFKGNAVSGVSIGADPAGGAHSLLVESIIAGVPPAPALPASLGKKPPVDGDWFPTLDQNFNGNSLDPAVWNVTGTNYWDKRSHLSPSALSVANGSAILRFEKKTGHENDDPANPKVNDYGCGFMETYGKWVQRYGYFEARMKLPKGPGLWPAFWMMPDRGGSDPQWKRADTHNGGMEFDILEYLSSWGPYRYNIAMHWDGYQKEHKSDGCEHNYVLPDKDGYITAGLLWTPGKVVYYANGHEMFRWENARISDVPSNLIFNFVSGGWENEPVDDAQLPAEFVIDYVRAWQRRDLSSAADTQRTALPAEPPAGAARVTNR